MATVYVGLSGGVDSSVSAALLKAQGYRVVGVYLKNWTQDVAGVACPWAIDLADARAAAAVLDIEFKVFDFQTQYRQRVVDEMIAGYEAGRTPNPDVLCNEEVKFKLFLEAALAEGADFIATGHYAGIRDGQLIMAADTGKDQTYFLYRVSRTALAKTLFPLAGLTKPEVRCLARDFGLATATKPDSQGICFVGEVGIKAFLSQYLTPVPGSIVLARTREVLGAHDGVAYYTVGQRHGLGLGGGQPYYVTRKDMASATVYVTDDAEDLELTTAQFMITDCHWISRLPEAAQTYHVRIRHRGELMPATVQASGKGGSVTLTSPAQAVASGQSAVIYDHDEVLGGGFITTEFD